MAALSDELRQELARLLAPLSNATGNAGRWSQILALVGQNGAVDTAALDAVGRLATIDGTLDGWDGIATALAESAQALDALRALDGIGPALAEQLGALYLRRYRPRLFQTAAALTLIDPLSDGVRDDLHPEQVAALLKDPWGTLSAAYLPNHMATAADAQAGADRLFPLLEALARELRLPATLEQHSLTPPSTDTTDAGLGHTDGPQPVDEPALPTVDLTPYFRTNQSRIDLRVADGTTAGTFLALAVTAASTEHPGGIAGYLVELAGALNWTRTSGPWTLTASSQGTLPAFSAGPGGLKLSTPAPTASAKLEAQRAGTFVLGASTGTRVELSGLKASAAVDGTPSVALTIAADQGRLVIAAGDGDGFLQEVLPAGGINVDFQAGVTLSSARGFELSGGAGLSATFPAHVSLGPIGTLDAVQLSLHEATAALTVHVGPVDVAIGGLGVEFRADATPGNLGVANLDVGFKPPTQLGLSIAAGPVSGGGFLAHDNGQYAGELHLSFEGIAVRAVGLLTTGDHGYSLLVLVQADLPPLQLGMGFMLVGVGGLLGINRTVSVDALRNGLKTGALGAILSPPDPKASAGQIVASLAGLFPPAPGRHIFAPTARIVWGTPTLLTIELGLVLELPSPVRLVALGRLKALLPSADDAVVKLQVDVLGVIDFDRAEASVDATLVDSRIASFAITGDMALRLNWGDNPNFLLAIGGFHPRFQPPTGFPAMSRVAIPLTSGDNPKLRLEAYLALTSNTVQFGARVDLAAKAGSFSIAGFLSFDALVTLSPLAFVVDIAAKLAVKVGGHTLLSISLALTLSGPRPWRARGKASFSILFFDVSFSFDVTIGDATAPALPAPVDVAPLVLQALADPRAWSAQNAQNVASLRQLDPGSAILAHPLATLQVRQKVVPLARQLDRFGSQVPSGAKKFTITTATIGGVRTSLAPLQDRFAPAQFTALSDDQKLSAPSFEEMTSGAQLGADGFATGAGVNVGVAYEQVVVTAAGIAEPKHVVLALPDDVFAALTKTTSDPEPAFALR